MMKERPILFSAPMVRALLDGSKTQTRRALSVQPLDILPMEAVIGTQWVGLMQREPESKGVVFHCKFGQPGDRLWVRESFWGCDMPGWGDTPCVVYDDEWRGKDYRPAEVRPYARKFGCIPSIHMPRDCSRIDLEITSVRVERLNDISDADCIAEGIERSAEHPTLWRRGVLHGDQNTVKVTAFPKLAYRSIWEQINGHESWKANPWVWVIEFRRIAP